MNGVMSGLREEGGGERKGLFRGGVGPSWVIGCPRNVGGGEGGEALGAEVVGKRVTLD